MLEEQCRPASTASWPQSSEERTGRQLASCQESVCAPDRGDGVPSGRKMGMASAGSARVTGATTDPPPRARWLR